MTKKSFTQDEQRLLAEIMQSRRDVRGNRFLSNPISDGIIDQILEAASWAPSVGYSQPWEFVVIRDESVKQTVSENFEAENKKAQAVFSDEKQALYAQLKLEGIREAPVNIAVFYKPSDAPVLGQHSMADMGEYSVVCAVQNMWLMARALNIGMGWVSILDPEALKTILNAPKGHKLVAYMCLGQVSEFCDRPELESLGWKERKAIHTSVFDNQYP